MASRGSLGGMAAELARNRSCAGLLQFLRDDFSGVRDQFVVKVEAVALEGKILVAAGCILAAEGGVFAEREQRIAARRAAVLTDDVERT